MPELVANFSARWVWVLPLLFAMGCRPEAQIRAYTVKREAASDRLLGGIVLRGEQAWYFKITAPKAELDAKLSEVQAFLKSLRFPENAERPEWDLPDGWKIDPRERPGRAATIRVPLSGSETAELSVIVLPIPPQQDETSYLLANVNRWRDQLGQGAIAAEELSALETISAQGVEVKFVSIAGKQKAGGMAAPFAS
jgi:hypothetical protein